MCTEMVGCFDDTCRLSWDVGDTGHVAGCLSCGSAGSFGSGLGGIGMTGRGVVVWLICSSE